MSQNQRQSSRLRGLRPLLMAVLDHDPHLSNPSTTPSKVNIHGGRTIDGVTARIAQRLLALTAALGTTAPPTNPLQGP
jgi:hypothetical protein